ncbi:MAG: 2-oxo acid dehydrogenase subunit E2 [Gemmatimonadota bacterium]|nr:2-oxo acid dehydrogenase subunit E2 [Gemmatimonadota bacterium]
MATKVLMEALSPTMEEGRLVRWLKNEGDAIKSGDVVAEVETDKAVMELAARGDGVLRKRIANEGDSAAVGTLLGIIAKPDEDISAMLNGAAPTPVPSDQSQQPVGTPADAGDVIAMAKEFEGVTSIPQTARQSQGEASTPPQERERRGHQRIDSAVRGSENGATSTSAARPRASPLARRLASERGVDLGALQGSGPGGRIVKRDIEEARAQSASVAAPRATRSGDYQDVPLTQMRKTIAKRLGESIGPIPTFYLTAEFDVTRVAELRDAMIELGAEYKVSFNDILIKATATALAQHPEVNAHWTGDAIRQFNRVHIGMAVAVPDGLITPVIFDANEKGLADIAAETRELAGRARERKLKPEEYTGSTFSVSNLGMFGIDQFTAIINPPEAGILAIGAVDEKPVVVDNELVVRKRVRVTMSCDHRAIDGATGAKFLQTLRRMVENPLMLVF